MGLAQSVYQKALNELYEDIRKLCNIDIYSEMKKIHKENNLDILQEALNELAKLKKEKEVNK